MAAISLNSVGLSFGSYSALHNLSFEVPRGQFVALVGPTGCGKSSVLHLVAGLLKPSIGTVCTGGRALDAINRDAVYMFQQDALLPWETSIENVMLGPILRGLQRRKRRKTPSRGSSESGFADSMSDIPRSSPADNENAWRWHRRSSIAFPFC